MKRRSFFAAMAGALAAPVAIPAYASSQLEPPDWDNDDGRVEVGAYADVVQDAVSDSGYADLVSSNNALLAHLRRKGLVRG